jgi:hypothetical protein
MRLCTPISFVVSACFFLATIYSTSAQAGLPGGAAQDVADAVSRPHEYAWRLFLSLNRKADQGRRGELDQAKGGIKEFEDDRPVVWVTWAKASGGRAGDFVPRDDDNTSQVFCPNGANLGTWEGLGPPEKALEHFRSKLLDALIPATSTPQPSIAISRAGEIPRLAIQPFIDVSQAGDSDSL